MKKLWLIPLAVLSLLALTAIIKPLDAMNALALGAAGSVSQPITVTATSAATFVPSGAIRLTCSQPTYYKVGTSTVTVSSTSKDGTNYGNTISASGATLQRPSWITVTAGSSQWLALIIKGGVDGVCSVEQMGTNGLTGSFTTLAASGATTLSSTLAVTGASTFGGNIVSGGNISGTFDGGTAIFGDTSATTLAVSGAATITGAQTLTGATAIGTSLTLPSSTALTAIKWGTITLGGQSPATGTATILSGQQCYCTPVTNAADGVTKCAVSSTTLTATGPNSSTGVINYLCVK